MSDKDMSFNGYPLDLHQVIPRLRISKNPMVFPSFTKTTEVVAKFPAFRLFGVGNP